MVPLSVLDLAPIKQGGDAGAALRESRDLAVHAEALGYRRFWLAEHHNMPGIASAATAVAIAHVAAGTRTIRVGAGGVMLPNHAPLVIAEQFGTLAALYPGRIDLGLGRAPGTDPATSRALRRTLEGGPEEFPRDVLELLGYLGPARPDDRIQAVPGVGSEVPVWILGSSDGGARIAAALGLPYAFASHFAPAALDVALDLYRRGFRPSRYLDRPHAMVAVNVIAAERDEDAELLATSVQQAFVALRTGRPGPLPPPRPGYLEALDPPGRALIERTLSVAAVGGPDRVRAGLAALAERTRADELITVSQIYDPEARRRSLAIASGATC